MPIYVGKLVKIAKKSPIAENRRQCGDFSAGMNFLDKVA
jgi:hypothetical protein